MSVVGTRIGRIRVESLLGEGGMGEVYVGYDETLQRQVALKSILAGRRLSSEAKARFVREAQVLSRLDHPNICKIYDFIEGEDREYLVLELIRGRDLMAAIEHDLDPADRLQVAQQIADALVAAHAEGVIHRDLKPRNVMLTQSGEVKVLDFGLARPGPEPSQADPASPVAPSAPPTPEAPPEAGLGDTDRTLSALPGDQTLTLAAATGQGISQAEPHTVLGTVMGTLTYMSPEQARGERVTTASDMYSFGLLLQTLFTGRRPYPSDTGQAELLRRALQADTVPVTGLDADLTRLIESLKAPAPATRPTAVEVAARLGWIAERPKRRAKWLAATAALVILVLGGLKYTFDLRRERTVAVEAREEADLRRSQAEDLIGFMLGDLREKLAPVGRLEILDDVGDKALEYFASLPAGSINDDELARRSKALYQVGEVRLAQGALSEAKAPLRDSLALARTLVEREPESTQRLFGLGQSHFWIGYVHLQLGELEDSRQHFQAYFDASKRLNDLEPENPEWQLELAYGHNNLGEVLRREGDIEGSLGRYRASADIRTRLVEASPEDPKLLRDLAHARSLLGRMLASSGQIADAVAEHEAALEIRQRLLALDPLHTDWQWNVAVSRQHLGRLALWQGKLDEAQQHFQADLDLELELVAHDPENTGWRRSLAEAKWWYGVTQVTMGDPRHGLESLVESERLLESLVRLEEGELGWAVDLAKVRIRIAEAQLELENVRVGLETSRSVWASLETLATKDPELSGCRRALALAALAEGRAWAQLGSGAKASAAWTRGLEVVEPAARGSRDIDLLDPWARLLLHLGRVQEALPILAQLDAAGYRSEMIDNSRHSGGLN